MMLAPVLYPAQARDLDPRDLLHVGIAQEMTGVDFRVSRMPVAKVSGTITGGGEGSWTSVRLRSPDDIVFGNGIARTASVRPDGTFLFEGVAPGRYQLRSVQDDDGLRGAAGVGAAPELVGVDAARGGFG